MFGFIGKPVSRVVIEANGYVSGTERRFNYDHGAPNNNYKARYYFDDDNVNATKATTQALLDTVNVPYDGKPLVNLPNYSDAALSYTIAGGVFTPIGSKPSGFINFRRFTYGSSAALSPATRKVRQEFDWNGVTKFVLNGINPSTDASNNIKGVVNLNMRQFPNLRSCWIQGAYISSLTIQFNNPRLESVGLVAIANLSSLSAKIPASVKYIFIETIGTISNLSTLLQDAVGCEALYLSEPLSNNFALTGNITTQTISGTLDVSHMTNLKVFVIGFNNLMTNLVLPLTNTAWDYVHIQQLRPTAYAAFNTAFLDSVLSNANIRALIFHTNTVTYAKNFGNSEVAASLVALFLYGNKITGDFIVTDPRPNMRDLRLGMASSEQNVFANIDLSGFDNSDLVNLYLDGVQCADLQLPSSLPDLTTLEAYDNKLDIVTNPDLVTKLNGYTSLVNLLLSINENTDNAAQHAGQDSVNGLGADPDFSGLVNCTQLVLADCKITGTLTLPNINKLVNINVGFNSGLTTLANLSSHASLQVLRANRCTSLALSIGTSFTSLIDIRLNGTQVSTIDLSGKTTTSQIIAVWVEDSTTLTSVTMPNVSGRANMTNSHILTFKNCDALTIINNLNIVGMRQNATVNYGFNAYDCAVLDMTFPLGSNNFCPTTINLSDNAGLSVANLDATIMNLHTNRNNYDFFSHSTRILNIGGTTPAASGIYQAPAVPGSPASPKEALHELVNVKGWTITFN